MSDIEIKEYTKTMIKSDYDLLMNELMPYDREIFTEKYINGKTNKELNLTSKKLNNFRERVIKAIKLIKTNKLEGISQSLLIYRCKKLGLDKNKIDFAIDCFINGLNRKEMADKYCLEPETIKKYRSNLRKQLENI
jgi:hypothetical protein